MATAAMAIKAAIAKAAFTILPFSIETELRLKYFMYTILIEVWGLSFVVSLAVYSSKPLQRKLRRQINLLSIIATFIYHNFRDTYITMISRFAILHLLFKINHYIYIYKIIYINISRGYIERGWRVHETNESPCAIQGDKTRTDSNEYSLRDIFYSIEKVKWRNEVSLASSEIKQSPLSRRRQWIILG